MQIPPIYKEALTPETVFKIHNEAEQLMASILMQVPGLTLVYHEPHYIVLGKAEMVKGTKKKSKKNQKRMTKPDLLAVKEVPGADTFYFYFEVTISDQKHLKSNKRKRGQKAVMARAELPNTKYCQFTLEQIEKIANDPAAYEAFLAYFDIETDELIA